MPGPASPVNRLLDLWKGGFKDLRYRPAHNMPVLDVLRSCAILLVFTAHHGGTFNAPVWLNKSFAYYGWTGVDLFFVLSGVLIGTQLWRELAKTGDIRVGRFLLRRGLRIWPLYYFFVLFVAAEVVLIGRNGSGLWADATYLSDYFHCQIGGSWSLSVEEQFYILAPLSLVVFKRLLKPARMWIVPVAALLLLNFGRMMTVWNSTLPEAALRQYMYAPINFHSDGLALGMLLAWVSVFRPEWIRSTAIRWPVAIAMFLCGAVVYRIMPIVTNFTALALIYGSLTLLGMAAARVPAVLNWHGFYLISRLSFGMYLNHFGLLEHMFNFMGEWSKSGGQVTYWLCYGVSLLFSIAIACVTFLLVEWPFLKLRTLWLAGKAVPKTEQAVPMNA